jgi:hypothetical protein
MYEQFTSFAERFKKPEKGIKSNALKNNGIESFSNKITEKGFLVNAYDASGLPCHFYIKCPDYMLAKMLKESNRDGCSAHDFGEISSSGFGHLDSSK